MPSMSRLHREVAASLDGPPRPVFLDSPAGFEPNAEAIAEKAVEYYRRYLQVDLRVAHSRHRESSRPAETASAIAEIRNANLVFAGPGSPTYALRQWRDSPVWSAVVARHETGNALLFASAAAVALGRFALPVYELYKVGADPYWADGLDLLGQIGLQVAVVPHFNDTSGGTNLDTRFCYMGGPRFARLKDLLPAGTTILGIDHYTAVTLDPASGEATVSGQGRLTVLRDDREEVYRAGDRLSFAALRSEGAAPAAGESCDEPEPAAEETGDHLSGVIAFVEGMTTPSEAERLELLTRLQAVAQTEGGHSNGAGAGEERFLEVLVGLRNQLRAEKRFDLADSVRNAISDLGYEVADGPTGSTWSRRRDGK